MNPTEKNLGEESSAVPRGSKGFMPHVGSVV